ncbi:MAG: SDR family NAD(P)-dependent oxidoreductase, partial [Acetobacteraceae bacterium]|nr:SDR family NAD(P)-dependent oxidoreductase [Acetobacteraceae bacterium]
AKLWLVTRGACAVETGDAVSVAQASVWGLGGVIANESPDLGCRLLDLAREGEADADAFASEVLSGSGEPRVALRQGGRFAARLRLRSEDELSGPPRPLRAGERGEIAIGTPGVLDSLSIKRSARRAPGPGEVEIEVHAAGLNFLDVIKAMGLFDPAAGSAPTLGAECAGRVVRVGANVGDVAVGDRVVAFSAGSQMLSSHAVVPATLTAKIADDLSYEHAAALPCVYLTSYFALVEAARMRAGETVLVHSATGGVGLSALHVARWLGARVIASAGTEEKRRYLRDLGIADVIDSRSAAFAATVADMTGGRGVDVVLNSLAGAAIPEGLAALAPYGRFLEIGKRDMWDNSRIGMGCLLQNRAMFGVDLAALTVEQPERAGALLRLVMERVADGTFPLLPVTIFPASRASEAFGMMAAAKHIGKLVIATHGMEAARDTTAAPVRPDATYLISGGLGALGLLAAQGLADLGARHLVLCGRKEPAKAALATIDGLRAKGVQVVTHALDIGDEAAVRRVFADVAANMPTLRGVVHGAGVLDDALTEELSADRFGTVMRGKVEGARVLDRCTDGLDLDFFVMFSSVAALLGSMGQGNYAAANAMLDAIAADRIARGLPALSIAWGPWAEIGLAAETANRGERIAGRGLLSLPPAEGRRMFERLLGAGTPYVAAMHFDRRRWMEMAAPATASLFADLPEASGDEPAGSAAADAGAFAGGMEAMSRLVVGQLAAVLRLSPDRVPSDKPFRSFGLDSLMGLELRNRLERALGLKLSASTIWNFPTANQLCAHLVARLDEGRPPPDVAAPMADPGKSAARDLEDELGEAEAMLADL